jgi:hypothetical protein
MTTDRVIKWSTEAAVIGVAAVAAVASYQRAFWCGCTGTGWTARLVQLVGGG